MKLIVTTAIGSLYLLVAMAASGVQAQTKPAKVVTRDELRVCMASESDLAARRQAMEPRGNQNRDEASAIRAEAEQMREERARIEEARASMDKFDRKVKVHNARVVAARASAESLRTDLEALNKALNAHNSQCGGISFLAEDKEAILNERAATK